MRNSQLNLSDMLNDWESIPLKYVCKLNPSVDLQSLGEGSDLTFLPMDRVKNGYFVHNSEKLSKYEPSYNTFEEGDIILAKVTPCFENGNIAIAENLVNGKGFGSSELFVIRATKVERKFLFYYFQSPTFKQEGVASMTGAGGLKRVSPDILRKSHIFLPPSSTQTKIANYLDRKTKELDQLIAAKKQLLELLDEKKRALIARAVIRGLNPDVTLKDSGIPWLGMIPKHWEVERSKWLFREIDQRSSEGEELLLSLRQKIGLIPHNDVSDKLISASNLIGYKHVKENQIVVNRMRAASGLIAVSPMDGLVSPDYAVFEGSERINPYFYEFLFQIQKMQTVFRSLSKGLGTGESGFLRLYSESFLSVKLPLPPLEEQGEIVARLQQKLSEMDDFSKLTETTISLFQERRTALISAAVTGKLSEEVLDAN